MVADRTTDKVQESQRHRQDTHKNADSKSSHPALHFVIAQVMDLVN